MVYLATQGDSVGGFHDKTAEVRDLANNSGFKGEEGEPEIGWEL